MKTKWIILIALLMSAPIVMQAQMKQRWGVKAGLNFSHISDFKKANSATSYHIGPMLEFMQKKLSSTGIEAALLYSRKGFDFDNQSKGVMNDYIEIPVNLKWRLNFPLVAPFLSVGPYANVLLGGEEKTYGSYSVDPSAFNFGLNFSAGLDIINVQLSLNFNWGLNDTYKIKGPNDIDPVSAKNRTFALAVAFLF
ncbi:MAG: PorT family protein [Tannerella sp.]|jgi:hypothetical protein|nr:PorT family protein [Tannerella sp.]